MIIFIPTKFYFQMLVMLAQLSQRSNAFSSNIHPDFSQKLLAFQQSGLGPIIAKNACIQYASTLLAICAEADSIAPMANLPFPLLEPIQMFLESESSGLPREFRIVLVLSFFTIGGVCTGANIATNATFDGVAASLAHFILTGRGGATDGQIFYPLQSFSPKLKTFIDPRLTQFQLKGQQMMEYVIVDHNQRRARFTVTSSMPAWKPLTVVSTTVVSTSTLGSLSFVTGGILVIGGAFMLGLGGLYIFQKCERRRYNFQSNQVIDVENSEEL